MNLGAVLAQISIDEAEKAARASSDWYASHDYAVKRDREARERAQRAADDAAIARMEAKYRKRYEEKKAAEVKQAAATALRGDGWRVLDRSYDELETFAKRIWHEGLCGIPWPGGPRPWRVRWGDLRGRGALGMCAYEPRLILLDPAALERARDPGEQLVETLVHEVSHSQHPGDSHGAKFLDTKRRLLAAVWPDVPAEPVAVAARPHPEPRKGVLFSGTRPTWPGAGEWEFR